MSYKDFKVRRSGIIPDIVIIEPSVFEDLRGNIYTSFIEDFYSKYLPDDLRFIHDKFAQSKKNVLRGLHGDNNTWKLISCVYGEIYEVVVDMRPDSDTYKKWDSFWLKSGRYSQVLVPPGFVNGYYVNSDTALFHYKLAYHGNYIDAGDQMTVKWNAEDLNIYWPCTDPILQPRDKNP